MAACWRALLNTGMDATILAIDPAGAASPFDEASFAHIALQVAPLANVQSPPFVSDFLRANQFDVLVISGWWNRAYVDAALSQPLPYVIGVDNAYNEWWRPLVVGARQRHFLRSASIVAVPGERARQFVTRAGVNRSRVRDRLYGVADLQNVESSSPRSRAFLFAGQYTMRKGLDVLLQAYSDYRRTSRDPFELWLAGVGPLQSTVRQVSGAADLGFLQPRDLQQLRSAASHFVLPSRRDSWPLGLVEAAAAGMGLIASDACGSAVELLRDGWNGSLVPTGDSSALTRALIRADDWTAGSVPFPKRSAELARPYGAAAWAHHWFEILDSL